MASSHGSPPSGSLSPDARRVLLAAGVFCLAVIGLLLLWYTARVLLLAFAGVLIGVLLHGLAKLVHTYLRLSHGWALTLVVVVLISLLGGILWTTGSAVAGQVQRLLDQLPTGVERVSSTVARHAWVRQVLRLSSEASAAADGRGGSTAEQRSGDATGDASSPTAPDPRGTETSEPGTAPTTHQANPDGTVRRLEAAASTQPQKMVMQAVQGAAPPITSTFRRAFGFLLDAVVALVVVSVVAIYVAADPASYVRGLVLLVPRGHRRRAIEILNAIGFTLRWWLIGQGITMVAIGTLTAAGLWLIGVELWLILGLLAALFNFIPNFGPLISFTPALLIAWGTGGGGMAMAVVGLYVVAQGLEGYVLTPLVQRKAVDLPPALLIVAQVLMGVLAGGLGVMLAAPLTAAVLVAAKMIYVEDTLGDEVDTPDDAKKDAAHVSDPPPTPAE